MYEVSTQASFSAAHHLLNYDGPCENVHGHNWLVTARVWCERLDDAGIGIDFKILKKALNGILEDFDHKDLNLILGINPSSENLAHHIFKKLELSIGREKYRIARVEVSETPGNTASYFEDI